MSDHETYFDENQEPCCFDCSKVDFPQKHENCGGVLHAEFIDESYDSVFGYDFCDKCDYRKEWD